jgi:RNA polymerase sigma-70 factor (ECF subfamily)
MEALLDHSAIPAAASVEATDEELMQAIIDRQQHALNQLYGRYRVLINKIVMEILPNEADAEEALQDVFMEIWSRAANFDVRKGKPLGWIICMARRRAIDHYRKIRRRADASEKLRLEGESGKNDIPGVESAVPINSRGGQNAASTSDLRAFLANVIRTLPEEQGRVIQLSYFEEMSQREIALKTGIPLGTIKTRLDLALRKLANKFVAFREELYYAH